ncbi:7106_t:CDS:1, partial [Dentiscutata heterogama]
KKVDSAMSLPDKSTNGLKGVLFWFILRILLAVVFDIMGTIDTLGVLNPNE